MSSKLRWMPDLLTGPSLGQYLRIRPGGEALHSNPQRASEEKGLSSTKQMLKKHMVDSFFERALHQIDPETAETVALEEQQAPFGSFEAMEETIVDDVVYEPIYEAEEPLDDSFLFAEAEEAVDAEEEASQPANKGLESAAPVSVVQEKRESEHTGPEHTGPEHTGQEHTGPEHTGPENIEPESVDSVTGPGYYIFAITLGHMDVQLPDLTVYGGNSLFVFPFGNAQAIISEVPLDVYSEEALQSRLNDPAWFEQTLRTHTDVLSMIQAQVSIVPMRVCTICDTVHGLDAFLKEHHDDFVSTLQLIEGNHSWRFSIFCNEPRLRKLTAKASNQGASYSG